MFYTGSILGTENLPEQGFTNRLAVKQLVCCVISGRVRGEGRKNNQQIPLIMYYPLG